MWDWQTLVSALIGVAVVGALLERVWCYAQTREGNNNVRFLREMGHERAAAELKAYVDGKTETSEL